MNTRFSLSAPLKKEYNGLMRMDWEILTDINIEHNLSPKDILILKLYFSLMGKEYCINSNKIFVGFIKKYFSFNKANLCKI